MFLVATEVLQKIGVVVGCDLAGLAAAVLPVFAEPEPEDRPDDGEDDDDNDPGDFVQRAHAARFGEDDVNNGENVKGHHHKREDDEESSHAVNLRLPAAYTCQVKPWLLYSVIRLATFAAVLVVLLLAQTPGWIAAIIAAIFGLAASYLFLGKLRAQVAQGVEDRRTGKTHAPTDDEDAEDELGSQNYLDDRGLEGDSPRK